MAGKSNRTSEQGRGQADVKPGRGEHGSQAQPGVMGDQTMEQSLNQKGKPDAAAKRKDAESAFRREGGRSD